MTPGQARRARRASCSLGLANFKDTAGPIAVNGSGFNEPKRMMVSLSGRVHRFSVSVPVRVRVCLRAATTAGQLDTREMMTAKSLDRL